MLVLSRKVGEEIRIGDVITISVRRLQGNRVAIGVKAPEDMRILRGELEVFAREFASVPPASDPEEAPESVPALPWSI